MFGLCPAKAMLIARDRKDGTNNTP